MYDWGAMEQERQVLFNYWGKYVIEQRENWETLRPDKMALYV